MVFCTSCGKQNEANATVCAQCGAALSAAGGTQPGGYVPTQTGQYGQPQANYGQAPTAYGQAGTAGVPPGGTVPSYMVQSILVTLFCCLPLGIWGIIKANQVNRLLGVGDYQGAAAASQSNKQLLMIAAGVGLVVTVISVAVQLMGHHTTTY